MREIFGDLHSFFSNAVPSLVEVEVTVVSVGMVVEGVGCKPVVVVETRRTQGNTGVPLGETAAFSQLLIGVYAFLIIV